MDNNEKEDKKYGLIISKKQLSTPKATNVFGNDDSSDEDDGTDWVRKALKAESEKNKIKKQTKLSMQKALKEDPTIYQYDEVYDDIGAKNQVKTVKVQERKPKYVHNFLKAAERRKKEQEHRIERMVQKEREAEGTMYADKESFVTSAYRAKLEEFKKMEEEEANMSRLESIGDVTKQQDMSGFYRHLYKQTIESTEETEKTSEKNRSDDVALEVKNNNDESITGTDEKSDEKSNIKKSKKNRQYRQRVIETYESDNESKTESETCNTNKSIINTEDKSSINQSISDSKEPDRKKQKCEIQNSQTDASSNAIVSSESKDNVKDLESISQKVDDKKIDDKENQENQIEIKKKERSSIWLKRTVGPVFEAALQRYYARKALRNAGAQ
ncbi:PREDICTED: nuclear speckle splicing regulatory protein 1 [Polistes dominula]|uniref:Nuclear speckle splicing regulatory protein 1 n=1 Tax=Polistes dominula TaxID=743375 RepID=A0ABM1JFY2_POLDO|nr:PREDICTED: nuclear speckle splicing regulatory protein 1 [Polistes dominula]